MKAKTIQAVREFNRFYTNVLGLVNNQILKTDYSLPEARMLYELSTLEPCSASKLIDAINMDKGYMSRLLKAFEKRGIISKQRDKSDTRSFRLTLTPKGRNEIKKINDASVHQICKLLIGLSTKEIGEVAHHMKKLKTLLSKSPL